jgi:hypothetical protein
MGANMEAVNDVGETVLTGATHSQQGKVVEHLLQRGAQMHHIDDWGFDPIVDAIFTDSHEALRMYLSTSRSVSTVLFNGKSLLYVAATDPDRLTMVILLDSEVHGADPDAYDTIGTTALDHLKQRDDYDEVAEVFGPLPLKRQWQQASL